MPEFEVVSEASSEAACWEPEFQDPRRSEEIRCIGRCVAVSILRSMCSPLHQSVLPISQSLPLLKSADAPECNEVRPWGLTRLTWWMGSWRPSLHWNEKRCVGQSQVPDNDLQHVRETAFHKPRTTLHLVSVPSKELYAKTLGTHFPEDPIFLSSSSDADTEQVTAGKQGGRGRPEEVISQINHIFLYSSGQLPLHSLARRKYQIFKFEQRLYRNLQEVVSSFAHTQLCLAVKTIICWLPREEKKHLKYRCSGRDLATRSVSKGNAPFPLRIKVAQRRPQPARARSCRNVVPATVNSLPQERPTFTTQKLLDPSIASVLRDSTERTSHELLHLVTRSRV